MIDAHLHLDRYEEEEIKGWMESGIQAVVAVSMNLESCYRTLELKQKYPNFVYAALGYHPEQPVPSETELAEIVTLIRKERASLAAIGEIGLPYYHEKAGEFWKGANEILKEFMKLAIETDLPIALHAVHEHAPHVLTMLKQHGVKKAHFHWLKAEERTVKEIMAAGYYVSVTPEVTYRERDRKLVEWLNPTQILLETDGPWPFHGSFHGRKTSPLFLKEMVPHVANSLGVSEEVCRQLSIHNALTLYGGIEG